MPSSFEAVGNEAPQKDPGCLLFFLAISKRLYYDRLNFPSWLQSWKILRLGECPALAPEGMFFQELVKTSNTHELGEEVSMMNKTDLINQVAEATNLTKKDAARAVDAVFESITEALRTGEKVQLIGFGNFEVRERAARKGRNPQTGAEIYISASKVPAFKPGKALKELIK